MQDPEIFLQAMGASLECAVDPASQAVLDPEHRARVNHETYFFSTPRARARFLADPLSWCGTLTDPVSGERFVPRAESPRLDHGGRPYFFASAGTRQIFERDPAAYADPKREMKSSWWRNLWN